MLKKISSLIIIIVVSIAIFNLGKQIFEALNVSNRVTQEATALSYLQKQNTDLNNRLKQVSEYDFIESVARNKLGMSKPGDTVVVIPKSSIDNILGAQKKVEEISLPNWQGWLKLLIH